MTEQRRQSKPSDFWLRFIPKAVTVMGWVIPSGALQFSLNYSAEQVSSWLRPFFPLERKQGPFSFCLSQPLLVFNDTDNSLGLHLELDLQGLGISTKGGILLKARVEYCKSDSSFYLVDLAVKELEVRGVPALILKSLHLAVNALLPYIFHGKAIYTFDAERLKEALAIRYLEAVHVRDRQLRIDIRLAK